MEALIYLAVSVVFAIAGAAFVHYWQMLCDWRDRKPVEPAPRRRKDHHR